jgi:fructokinase
MDIRNEKFVSIGEVLWDVFPDGKQIGGAPLNFAWHALRLGADASIVSCVGDDTEGRKALALLRERGIDTGGIQLHPKLPTGRVVVNLRESGHDFEICEGVAYDNIEATIDATARVRAADVVCFGTLAQRADVSRKSVRTLVREAENALVVFDINIRQIFYSDEVIRESLEISDVLKLNEDEVPVLGEAIGAGDAIENVIGEAMRKYGLSLVCVTMGAAGCRLWRGEESVHCAGYNVKVADTVGSGDAFTAALMVGYLEDMSLTDMGSFANATGAFVASVRGAMPVYVRIEIENLMTQSG